MNPNAPERPKVVAARSAEENANLFAKPKDIGVAPIQVDPVEFLEPQDWPRVDKVLTYLGRFQWAVLTSPRGVSIFANRMRKLGVWPVAVLLRIAAVGEIAKCGEREGLEADHVDSELITGAIESHLPKGAGVRVLLLRADRAGRVTEVILKRRGSG